MRVINNSDSRLTVNKRHCEKAVDCRKNLCEREIQGQRTKREALAGRREPRGQGM